MEENGWRLEIGNNGFHIIFCFVVSIPCQYIAYCNKKLNLLVQVIRSINVSIIGVKYEFEEAFISVSLFY